MLNSLQSIRSSISQRRLQHLALKNSKLQLRKLILQVLQKQSQILKFRKMLRICLTEYRKLRLKNLRRQNLQANTKQNPQLKKSQLLKKLSLQKMKLIILKQKNNLNRNKDLLKIPLKMMSLLKKKKWNGNSTDECCILQESSSNTQHGSAVRLFYITFTL